MVIYNKLKSFLKPIIYKIYHYVDYKVVQKFFYASFHCLALYNMNQRKGSAEKKKNLQALGYTAVSILLLVCLVVFVGWTSTPPPPQNTDEGIEVNLGNSDQGVGDVAPMIPGEPSANNEPETPPEASPANPTPDEPETNKEVAENNDASAPEIKVSPKPKEKPKVEELKAERKHVKLSQTKAVVRKQKAIESPKPTPPTPKAVYKGGANKGTGGNGADSYNGFRNQGIAGGNGDQGKINGNPNSNNYNGNGGTGHSGVSVRAGLRGRWFTSLPSFEDNFNENAKVAVDIVVNRNGNITSASINPRGTTTTNANIRGIALRKARQLKFNAGQLEEQSGTIVFNFKLRG